MTFDLLLRELKTMPLGLVLNDLTAIYQTPQTQHRPAATWLRTIFGDGPTPWASHHRFYMTGLRSTLPMAFIVRNCRTHSVMLFSTASLESYHRQMSLDRGFSGRSTSPSMKRSITATAIMKIPSSCIPGLGLPGSSRASIALSPEKKRFDCPAVGSELRSAAIIESG